MAERSVANVKMFEKIIRVLSVLIIVFLIASALIWSVILVSNVKSHITFVPSDSLGGLEGFLEDTQYLFAAFIALLGILNSIMLLVCVITFSKNYCTETENDKANMLMGKSALRTFLFANIVFLLSFINGIFLVIGLPINFIMLVVGAIQLIVFKKWLKT